MSPPRPRSQGAERVSQLHPGRGGVPRIPTGRAVATTTPAAADHATETLSLSRLRTGEGPHRAVRPATGDHRTRRHPRPSDVCAVLRSIPRRSSARSVTVDTPRHDRSHRRSTSPGPQCSIARSIAADRQCGHHRRHRPRHCRMRSRPVRLGSPQRAGADGAVEDAGGPDAGLRTSLVVMGARIGRARIDLRGTRIVQLGSAELTIHYRRSTRAFWRAGHCGLSRSRRARAPWHLIGASHLQGLWFEPRLPGLLRHRRAFARRARTTNQGCETPPGDQPGTSTLVRRFGPCNPAWRLGIVARFGVLS